MQYSFSEVVSKVFSQGDRMDQMGIWVVYNEFFPPFRISKHFDNLKELLGK